MKAINIQWDVDNKEELYLPTEIQIPEYVAIEDISDYISEETGFRHNGFEVVKNRSDCKNCWKTALENHEYQEVTNNNTLTNLEKEVFVRHILRLCEKLPCDDSVDADFVLADITRNENIRKSGIATDILNTWLSVETEKERIATEKMFQIFVDIEFADFLDKCLWMIARVK